MLHQRGGGTIRTSCKALKKDFESASFLISERKCVCTRVCTLQTKWSRPDLPLLQVWSLFSLRPSFVWWRWCSFDLSRDQLDRVESSWLLMMIIFARQRAKMKVSELLLLFRFARGHYYSWNILENMPSSSSSSSSSPLHTAAVQKRGLSRLAV